MLGLGSVVITMLAGYVRFQALSPGPCNNFLCEILIKLVCEFKFDQIQELSLLWVDSEWRHYHVSSANSLLHSHCTEGNSSLPSSPGL